MKQAITRSLLLVLALFVSNQSFAAGNNAQVIYGNDDRKDLYEVLNPMLVQLADSTVALISKGDLQQNSSGMVNISAQTFMARAHVCAKEKFADQPSGAFCSGALVGKNLILTAGHCITDDSECASTKFAFNYNVKQKGRYPTAVAEQDVVGCKKIIHREENGEGADFALIEIDREITHHAALKMNLQRRTVNIDNTTKLAMIGHPSGLPTKVDAGGSVRDNSPEGFFVATTDSYGGNSGSSVFNLATGEIEGVLVRGERDFVSTSTGCRVSNVCAEDGCRGEDVTKIAAVLPFMP